jgi:hypothetical protein
MECFHSPALQSFHAEHHSLLVFIEDIDTANKCIQKGILINYQMYPTEKYVPQLRIKQCFNCHGYRHRANECKDKRKCGRCGKRNRKMRGTEILLYTLQRRTPRMELRMPGKKGRKQPTSRTKETRLPLPRKN